ncbi:hypothetical protein CL629_02760 [bacterium]|nr:hypothetical protein [bacterium]|tara:strand:- start:1566 stop:1976 length:411 start_codon:yes stop_codon:yes gene_type:complete
MKIFVICSKRFYDKIKDVEHDLKKAGHSLTMPNCYDDPATEERYRTMGREEHSKWKGQMIEKSEKVIKENDAVLVLNFEKDGMKNYIGGATFLEMYDAFKLGKKIFLYNDVPEGILHDEIVGFDPVFLNGDLKKIA